MPRGAGGGAPKAGGAADPFGHDGDTTFETIRGGRGGRLQIVATRAGKWSKRIEDLFLDILRGCGNISLGLSLGDFPEWPRRRWNLRDSVTLV